MNMHQSSPTVWKGELPKIGIRPTIDGRLGGVRESLEHQTMNLARRVGMRVEDIDMTEFVGRMNKGQFDQAEYEKALAWAKENCPEGKDYNSDSTKRSREQIDSEWSDSVKMSLIARDLMVGKPEGNPIHADAFDLLHTF
ncbi:hypothetical protein [Neorhodopirellula pilleata]|uniref:L-fucose isomerase n=1 Tax=Neorhodopirellula pilleata TaxID=2714738 RepID=A0A5C6AVJ6_9BACT|nr:hypothetical protein [Neorhodopirellula pilleata]TWU03507.1 L-fucose isomerase [Neorhodopirellula pilleata]